MKVLGFDAGARWVGWGYVEAGAGRVELFIAGGKIDASIPRRTVDALISGDKLPVSDALYAAMREADLWAIEAAEEVYPREGFSPAMATSLAKTARVERDLGHLADRFCQRHLTVQAAQWRKAFCGGPSATDTQIARVFRLRFGPSVPRRSSTHLRDAAWTALYAALRSRLILIPSPPPGPAQSRR